MREEAYRSFSQEDHETWHKLFSNLQDCRRNLACREFVDGVAFLGLSAKGVPDLAQVNKKLLTVTGWQGVAVEGLEGNESFFSGLAERKFPIGNFIRDAADVNYTPAPDVFHDLYGHLPFFVNQDFADFCHRFGVVAANYTDSPLAMELWGRLFWFGVEFSLVKENDQIKIFGGGILSSAGESNYSVSKEPEVRPFSVVDIVDRTYKIDEFQKVIYLLETPQQLYGCLEDYSAAVDARLSTHGAR